MGISAKASHINVQAYLDPNSDILFKHLALNDSVSLVDGLLSSVGRNLALADSVTLADVPTTLLGADLQQVLNDSVTATEALVKSLEVHLFDTATFTEDVSKSVDMILADLTTITENPVPVNTPTAITTWDAANKNADYTLSVGDRRSIRSATSSTYAIAKATQPKNTGQLYLEVTPVRISAAAAPGFWAIGLSSGTTGLSAVLGGTASASVSYDQGGTIYSSGSIAGAASSFTFNDTVAIAVDFFAGKWWVKKIGGNWNGDALANPATGAGGLPISTVIGSAYISMGMFGGVDYGFDINTGNAAFVGSLPSGFAAWG